jgi:hypothetical protein
MLDHMRKYIVILLIGFAIISAWFWVKPDDRRIAGYSWHTKSTEYQGKYYDTKVFTRNFEVEGEKSLWMNRVDGLLTSLGAKRIAEVDSQSDWVVMYYHAHSLVIARINKPTADLTIGYSVTAFLNGMDNINKFPSTYSGVSSGQSQLEMIMWYPIRQEGDSMVEMYRGKIANGDIDFKNPELVYKGILSLR